MNICPNCSTGFQDEEEFCLDCGLKLTSHPSNSTDFASAPVGGVDVLAPNRSASENATQTTAGPVSPVGSPAPGASSQGRGSTALPGAPAAPRGKRKKSDASASAGVGTSSGKAASTSPGGRGTARPLHPLQAADPGADRLMRYRPVYKAPDEWTAVTIRELLSSAGLTAQVLPMLDPFEDGIDRLIEGYWGKVVVLESDLEDACRLIGDYLRGLDRSMH